MLVAVCVVAMVAPASAAEQQQPKRKATVRQVASVVAARHGELVANIDKATSGCLTTCTFNGELTARTVMLQASTLGLELDAINDRSPKNRLYLGTVPKELRRLVSSTIGAVEDVQDADTELSACTTNCAAAASGARLAWAGLKSKLNAWGPYL